MNTPMRNTKHPKIATQCPPLTAYIAGAIGTTAILAAPQAEAAVTAVSFGFGSVLDISDGSGNSPVYGGFGALNIGTASDGVHIGWPGLGGGSVYNSGSVTDGAGLSGLITFLADGAIIGTGANGPIGIAFAQDDNFPSRDLTSDQLNKNIGFQTSTGNWGWANVSWSESAKALTFNSAFVESEVGTSITVAAVPEPSRALLALAGLGGVALRRRRKQAA